MYKTISELKSAIDGIVTVNPDGLVTVINETALQTKGIDLLVYNAVFNDSQEVKDASRWLIRMAGQAIGIIPASIQSFYEAMGRQDVKGFTVPAINIRGMVYDSARAVFRAAAKNGTGALIFEIAKSEIQYTYQAPAEYTTVIMAAAIKEGFRGPLFIQGDHFQAKASKFVENADKEIGGLKTLITEAIDAGFYNIDIDASTLVDLSQDTLKEQQRYNSEVTAELTAFIRKLEPSGVTVSVGGEIGEVGKKNSTVDELRTFLETYQDFLKQKGNDLTGISKISVQTGTSHGGVPLPDGSIAKVNLDFKTLEDLSNEARTYGLCGAVQHGASTLPDEAFDKFPATTTAEVHLATGFQNIIYDSPNFPADLKEKMYAWIEKNCADERKEDQTDEQFYYKTRKKGFGPLKQELWNLPENTRIAIGKELEDKFDFLFQKLNVGNTAELIKKFVKPVKVTPPVPKELIG